MPNNKVYALLEFNKVKDAVAEYAASSLTAEEIQNSAPSFDKYEIERNLSLTREADVMLNKLLLNPVCAFDDVTEILEKAKKDSTLSMSELLKVGRLLKSARIAQTTINRATEEIILLKEIVNGAIIDKTLEKDIYDIILSDFEMSDTASDKLYGLRKKILSLNAKLKEKLLSYTRTNDSSKYLQDNLVTIREGRYVLPVKSECRGEVPGLVHDRSATGSTVFVEPFAIVELNNELRFVMAEEQAEVERILRALSDRVALGADSTFICQNICIIIDEVFCKAKYSIKIHGILPEISDKNAIKLDAARHPLIDNEKVVPIDIECGNDFKILLITGPNTGGKTVCLKTVGLFCLMAYFGLYLPCVKAKICVFDDIFADIGDEQSIENELSTFSSHVKNLIKITENMTPKSLVLLDEVGGGTDPTEGAALAVGIVKYTVNVGATAIFTTHYDELKEFAMTCPQAQNACMQFDENTLSPTYKLIIGMPGTSNALKIAKRLGLNPEIIEYARNTISEEKIKFEKVLQNAENIKNRSLTELEETRAIKAAISAERAEIEKTRTQLNAALDKIRANAAAETKRLVSGSMERANEIIEEMNEQIRLSDEAALLKAKKLRNELEGLAFKLNEDGTEMLCDPIANEEIKPGVEVVVKSLNAVGAIVSTDPKKRKAIVRMGLIKTSTAYSDLGKPIQNGGKTDQPTKSGKRIKNVNKSSGSQSTSGESGGFTQKEINVIGMTVSEAIEAIEPFILAMNGEDGAKILRIVHGKGTGALGRGIQSYLKSSPLVAEYRYGRYGEGDNGVTIATLK